VVVREEKEDEDEVHGRCEVGGLKRKARVVGETGLAIILPK
jgi:hypothetical protein